MVGKTDTLKHFYTNENIQNQCLIINALQYTPNQCLGICSYQWCLKLLAMMLILQNASKLKVYQTKFFLFRMTGLSSVQDAVFLSLHNSPSTFYIKTLKYHAQKEVNTLTSRIFRDMFTSLRIQSMGQLEPYT